MLLLVQRSDDRDLQLWRKHAHTSPEGKETSSKVNERLLGGGPTNMIIEWIENLEPAEYKYK